MRKFISFILVLSLCLGFSACAKQDLKVNTVASGIEEYSSEASEVSADLTESVTEKNEVSDTVSVPASANGATKPTEADTASTLPVTVTEKPTASQVTCTVQVECKEILNKKNKFKKDPSLLPPNGNIISATVTLNEGATAYDALKKACQNNGVELNEKDSSFGKYIVGIGGINEKDCGNTSGWTYKVNDKSPSMAMDKYTLKNGDSLVLSYVC